MIVNITKKLGGVNSVERERERNKAAVVGQKEVTLDTSLDKHYSLVVSRSREQSKTVVNGYPGGGGSKGNSVPWEQYLCW